MVVETDCRHGWNAGSNLVQAEGEGEMSSVLLDLLSDCFSSFLNRECESTIARNGMTEPNNTATALTTTLTDCSVDAPNSLSHATGMKAAGTITAKRSHGFVLKRYRKNRLSRIASLILFLSFLVFYGAQAPPSVYS